MTAPFPFTAIVAQDDLKLALLLNALDPLIGGVLVRGHKGTAKSTAVRALAGLLPPVEVVAGCPYSCDPDRPDAGCPAGPHAGAATTVRDARLVELPVGATEDRVAGSLDIERALIEGARAFEPGLLARAHRGVLYVDEVNLLNDHLVDLLLDAAAMGRNHVEREGVSVSHPARFLLVGTMNPEEGELRPQLLDRFGLTVEVAAPTDAALRTTVVRRRLAYDRDHDGFAAAFAEDERDVGARIVLARKLLDDVVLPDAMLLRIARVCAAFEVDGLRADIVIARTAAAVAAWEGRTEVMLPDVRTACLLALPHRRRRSPFEQPGIDPDELDRILDDDPDPPDAAGPEEGERGDGGDDTADAPEGRDRGAGSDPRGDDDPDGDGGPRKPGGGRPDPAPPADGPEDDAGPRERPADRDTFGRDPGDPGRTAEADGGEVELHGIGTVFTPALLTVPGVGAGAWGRRSPARGAHGATVGARSPRSGDATGAAGLAVAATMRAAAPHQHARGRQGSGLALRPEDLRRKIRQGREGNLVVFVVDASGSMAARRRMVAVKGAIRSLLLDAYQRRDKIALVTFRGRTADLALPPTASTDLAERRLADLPTGGRTPLAAGLHRAGDLLAVEATRDPDRRPLVVVLTDGRANVAVPGAAGVGGDGADPLVQARIAGHALARRGVATVVVDTEEGFVRLGLARELAAAMAGPCLRLEELAAAPLAGAVRTLASGSGPQTSAAFGGRAA